MIDNIYELDEEVEEINNAIEEMFGYGAKILEIEIMKHLHVKIGSSFEYFPEKEELLFVDYIDAARMHVHLYHH